MPTVHPTQDPNTANRRTLNCTILQGIRLREARPLSLAHSSHTYEQLDARDVSVAGNPTQPLSRDPLA